MENKKFLNEENYQNSVKKLKRIALIILIAGLLIGGSLIVVGIVKLNSNSTETTNPIQDVVDNMTEETSSRTEEEVQNEIDQIDQELITLKAQKNQEFTTNGFSEEYYRLENEIDKRTDKKRELSSELFEIQNKDVTDSFNSVFDSVSDEADDVYNKAKSIPFFFGGGVIIMFSSFIALAIYLFAKKRDIMAFTAQQTIPVAKEIVEDVTPTIGNAAGSIGKEIAKGITEGIKEGTKDDNQDNQ